MCTTLARRRERFDDRRPRVSPRIAEVSSRKSSPADPVPTEDPTPDPSRTAGKGRPTRSRREAQAERHRPLVVTDRKEARRRSRAKAQQQRTAAQRALVTGDEANLPYQHRGAQRRFVRDVVDSRRNIVEFVFPIAIVLMILSLVLTFVRPELQTSLLPVMTFGIWGGLAICVVDAFILRGIIRRGLTARFGSIEPGAVGYGIMRQIQIRRLRLPKPMIKHGEKPRS